MQPFTKTVRWGALILIGPVLASCSEYLAHREGLSIYGGDAVAGNQVKQMVDPWPAVAADRNIAYDGIAMQRAVNRYHTGRVIAPVASGTSGAFGDAAAPSQPGDATPIAPSGPPPSK
jgi:hypothetical protein